MNRKTALLCATATLGIGAAFAMLGQARAADLPSHKAAPPAPVSTVSPWDGFYAGVNVGGLFGIPDATVLASGSAPFVHGAGTPLDPIVWTAQPYYLPAKANLGANGGFVGGFHAGWNQTFGRLLIGVEADVDGLAGAAQSVNFPIPSVPGQVGYAQLGRAIDILGFGGARAGFLLTPNWLVYAKGGLGWAHASTGLGVTSAVSAITTPASQGALRAGWAAGAGVEFMLTKNLSVKVEYERFDIGHHTVTANAFQTGAPIVTANAIVAQQHAAGNLVRAGISYHFSGLSLTGNPVTDFGMPTPTGNVTTDGKAFQNWFASQGANLGLPAVNLNPLGL